MSEVQTELNLDIIQKRSASLKKEKQNRPKSIEDSDKGLFASIYDYKQQDMGLYKSMIEPKSDAERHMERIAMYDDYIDFEA